MSSLSFEQFRQQFPLLNRKAQVSASKVNTADTSPFIYFDNAATTQKPAQVIEAQEEFYESYNANVHRSSHQLSGQATAAFEKARHNAKSFINANSDKEIIWTSGTTESINIITQCCAKNVLNKGDEIILSVSEHHANIVPWQIVAEQTGAVIKVVTLDEHGCINLDELDKLLNDSVKFVACAHISNVIGKINPIDKVIEKARAVGALTIVDGAQAVAHLTIDVQALGCDFYVFSAHKMYGPTGVGLLYGKQHLLETFPPYQGGGEMIKTVSFTEGTTYNTLPYKLEAGTPNISGVIGFGASFDFLSPLLTGTNTSYAKIEEALITHCYEKLSTIEQVKFIVNGKPDIGVIAFTIEGQHNHDIAAALDSYGIAVRSGHHCAMPLMGYFKLNGCIRVSLAAYNTYEEVEYFISKLVQIIEEESNQLIIDDTTDKKTGKKRIENTAIAGSDLNANGEIESSALLNGAAVEIVNLFSNAKSWDTRHREIMLLGKNLPRLDKSLRSDTTLISGCESLAWLHSTQSEHGIYTFTGDSDAKVIRGLLVIVLAAYNNKTKQQVIDVDIQRYFEQLGLMHHLSPSRGNGLLAIVDKIKQLAQ